MALVKIQRELENLYSIQSSLTVDDFLISTQEMKTLYPDLLLRPQVIFKEKDGEFRIGVHVGDDTVTQIKKEGWIGLELSDFVSTTEEISHFLYLIQAAKEEKKVSLLDVELQAEIDKFLLAVRYYPGETELFTKLFENIHYMEGISEEEADRYQEANRLGAKMVKWLQPYLCDGEPSGGTLDFLRSFYRLESQNRLNKVEKMKRI